MSCGIYRIVHVATQRSYVGQSLDVERRVKDHLSQKRSNVLLSRAISKYGVDAFSSEILELCDSGELDEKEKYWIQKLNSVSPGGFNLTHGGKVCLEFSESTKDKLRASLKAYWELAEPAAREKRRLIGLANMADPILREKSRQAAKDFSAAPEGREKRRQAALVRWSAPGAREKQSQISRSQWDDVAREERRLASIRLTADPEVREKVRQAGKRRAQTPEGREKLRQAALSRWAKQKGETL